MDLNERLLSFISRSPTAFHAVENTARALADAGFEELIETQDWSLAPGARCFVRRNASSLIAFRVPRQAPTGFLLSATHSDSPCFKLKESAVFSSDGYVKLGVEKYGNLGLDPPCKDKNFADKAELEKIREHMQLLTDVPIKIN